MRIQPQSWMMIPIAAVALLIGFVGALFVIQLHDNNSVTTTTSSFSGLELVEQKLSLLRGCSDEQVTKWAAATGTWDCANDSTTSVTGAGADVLDLGDDSSNESDDITEFATTNDTNSIVTEPSADKMLFDMAQNWPTADAATALSANPADCAANQFADAIAANGDLTCAAIVDADVPDTITIDLAATATALAANPTDCGANEFATAIVASGNLTCSQPDHGNLAGLADDDHTQYALLAGRAAGQTLIGGTGAGDDITLQTTSNAAKGSYIFSELDCTGNSNGGALTADASGVVTCSDDDGGGGGSGDVTDVGEGCATGACLTDGLATTGTRMFTWEGTGVDVNEYIFEIPSNPASDFTWTWPAAEIADDEWLIGSGAGTFAYDAVPDCDDTGGNHLNYDTTTNNITCGTSSSVTDTNANTICTGTTNYLDGEGGCDNLDDLADFETATDDAVVVGNGSAFETKTIADCNTNNRDRLQYDTATNAFSCDTDTLGTADVAGLDISDDTNLTCGRSLTVSGDGCDSDVELYTVKKSIVILNPTTSETNLVQFEYPLAATIAEVSCSTNVGTATIQLDERARATPNSAGTNVMTSSLVCDTDSQTTTSFTNAGIAADVPVNLQITATATTPGVVRIHIEATMDD